MQIHLVTAVDPNQITGPLETPVVIGRSEDADVRLQDIWSSRFHCEIDEVDGELRVRDLKSTHGTMVNETQIVDAPLNSGDELIVGLTRFTVITKDATPVDRSFQSDESQSRMQAV